MAQQLQIAAICSECTENTGTQYCSQCHKVVCNDDFCVDTIWKKHQRARKNKHICDLVEIVLSEVKEPSQSDKKRGMDAVMAIRDEDIRTLKRAGKAVYHGVLALASAAAYIAPELAENAAKGSYAALFGKNVVNVAKAAGYDGVRGSGLSFVGTGIALGLESGYHLIQYFLSKDPDVRWNFKLLTRDVTKVWLRGAAGFGGYALGMTVGKSFGAGAGMALAGPVGAMIGGALAGAAAGFLLDWIMQFESERKADKLRSDKTSAAMQVQTKALTRFGMSRSDLKDKKKFNREKMGQRYRRMARTEHPDRYPSEDKKYQTKRCADLVAAYGVILAILENQ